MQLLDPDGSEWAERSEFWMSYSPPQKRRGPKKKYHYREPLILCGHGIRIRVDHQTLLIRTGLTHYPQKPEGIRLFPGDANLPDRLVILDGSGGVSFDALNWMAEQRIEFVRLDWRGEVSSIGGGSGYCARPEIVEMQRALRGTKREMQIARSLIGQKIASSIETLKATLPKSEGRDAAIKSLASRLCKIRDPRALISKQQLLGLEGVCAAEYFKAWAGMPLNWKAKSRKPRPPNWSHIQSRGMVWRDNSKNARHAFNAMLNYGYGILINRVRSEVVAAGFDPAIGILHGNKTNRIPLVYDLMEPLRPEIDKAVLEFVRDNTFSPGDFSISKWGGCRLNPRLASVLTKAIAQSNLSAENSISGLSRSLH
jgi:CRISPR-associated endonuclease Cas1